MSRKDWLTIAGLLVSLTTGGCAYAISVENRLTTNAVDNANVLRTMLQLHKNVEDIRNYLLNNPRT